MISRDWSYDDPLTDVTLTIATVFVAERGSDGESVANEGRGRLLNNHAREGSLAGLLTVE